MAKAHPIPAAASPSRGTHRLRRSQLVRRPRSEVFAFFSDAANLAAVTPRFLKFRIVSPLPIRMAQGALIDYRLSLFGVPFAWRTRIDVWEPERRFVDVQLRGPYRVWHHTHEFLDVSEGTLVVDTVDYALPLEPLSAPAHALFVKRSVERIFDHRRARIEELLPPASTCSATG